MESLEQGWNERPEPRPGSWAFQLALCLLGPLFFLSYLFTVLAPLPALYLHVGTPNSREGRVWSIAGAALGTLLAFAIKGWLGALGYGLLVALPALVLGELLLRKKGPERAVLGAVLAVALASSGVAFVSAQVQGVPLVATARSLVETNIGEVARRLAPYVERHEENGQGIDPKELQAIADSPGLVFHDYPGLLPPVLLLLVNFRSDLPTLAKTPARISVELPGLLLAFLLLLCALPCIALIRWNPKGFLRRTEIARDFLRRWRTPDWFLLPTVIAWALWLFPEVPLLSDLGGNLFLALVLIYFFQGLSILAYFLDSLRLRGPIRIFFYGSVILFQPLSLLVAGFGMFDLWGKFRTRKLPNRSDE